jgi:hypothetical protein
VPGDGKYAKVYYTIVDDERFANVYHEARHLGTWLQLLLVADAMYPAAAPVPAYVAKASLTVLVNAGLIELQPHQHYRVHGLASEREMRAQYGRNAAAVRWQSDRNASKAEHSKAEQSIEEQRNASDDGRLDLEAWLLVKYRAPSPAQRAFLDTYQAVFDETGPARAERLILSNPSDPIGALKADLAAFREERRAEAEKAERKPEQPKRRGSGLTGINAELAAMLSEQYAAEAKP